jgi:CRISPR-associated endoribonuclease Cas6
MLIRSTWTLAVAEPTTLPRTYGLELVKQLHQRLGIEIGAENIPSTTCSGILGSIAPSEEFVTFHPDEFYQLTLCGLQEHSSKAIASLFPASDSKSALEFLGAKFNLIDREDEVSSYEALYHAQVATEPEPTKRFELRFLTPTAFSQSRLHLPLPVPALMVRSWLERWNHFAPVYLGSDELVEYLSGAIAISRHKIQTRSFIVYNGRMNGFIGDVTLQILSQGEPLLANVANLLIQYAQWSGTGMKTRLGMGHTHLKKEADLHDRQKTDSGFSSKP